MTQFEVSYFNKSGKNVTNIPILHELLLLQQVFPVVLLVEHGTMPDMFLTI